MSLRYSHLTKCSLTFLKLSEVTATPNQKVIDDYQMIPIIRAGGIAVKSKSFTFEPNRIEGSNVQFFTSLEAKSYSLKKVYVF